LEYDRRLGGSFSSGRTSSDLKKNNNQILILVFFIYKNFEALNENIRRESRFMWEYYHFLLDRTDKATEYVITKSIRMFAFILKKLIFGRTGM